MRNLITDVAGLRIGHATDMALGSGVTAIVFDTPATASVSVRGGAPAGRDMALLELDTSVTQVDAIVLSGGSAFGLDAGAGAQAALREMGRGLIFGGVRLPLAPTAILFDLANGGNKDWGRWSPYRELAFDAVMAADEDCALGSVGAGTGATTATLKGGLGSASAVTAHGHRVGAVVAVNAVGTATIGDGPHFWAAPFETDDEFGGLGWPSGFDLRLHSKHGPPSATATTIGLVATDATLTQAQAKRLAIMADDGLARAIHPAHAPMDGDTVFAASTGLRPIADPVRELTELGHVAGMVMARAIARAVFHATSLPYPPGMNSWRDRFGS
jgi:L-aminopeptidase/D-esterase-like protein